MLLEHWQLYIFFQELGTEINSRLVLFPVNHLGHGALYVRWSCKVCLTVDTGLLDSAGLLS